MRWALAASIALVACGGAPVRGGPAVHVAALTAGLRAGDAPSLAATLGRPEAEIQAQLDGASEQLAALADRIDAAPLEEGAHVFLASGERVHVVREGEVWRIDRGVLGAPGLSRPEDAVRALHAALSRARWEDLVVLMSSASRAVLEDEARRWIEGTRDVDALEIAVDGDVAVVRTPTGGTIDLAREGGEWRVVELR